MPGPVTARSTTAVVNQVHLRLPEALRFSLRTMISGAPNSNSRFRRLLRLITRRYRSFRSLGGKTAAVQLHHGPQVWRNYRNHVQNHPLGFVTALAESFHHFQPLHSARARFWPSLSRSRSFSAKSAISFLSLSLISSKLSARSISLTASAPNYPRGTRPCPAALPARDISRR